MAPKNTRLHTYTFGLIEIHFFSFFFISDLFTASNFFLLNLRQKNNRAWHLPKHLLLNSQHKEIDQRPQVTTIACTEVHYNS